MAKSILSVVVPVYNKAPFLERCLDSIKAQNLDDVQVIVIDDGSTDGSGDICDKYDFEIYHTKNRGVSEARNKGVQLSKGSWITFMDADDSYEPTAFDVMKKIAVKDINSIVQFGQFRHLPDGRVVERNWGQGIYRYNEVRRQWVGVWNKMYKAELLKGIKYIKGLQFGEDELFNIEYLLKNQTLYQAPQNLVHHYFDDKNSLCRKDDLPVDKLQDLIRQLQVKKKQLEDDGAPAREVEWIQIIINKHYNSPTFARRGYMAEAGQGSGKYDVVYFLKDTPTNEELRYSLRSVVKNVPYRHVVFVGGCPDNLRPDLHIPREQVEDSKFKRVRESIRACCMNPNVSDDFWLFNDDFFVMRRMSEDMPPQYNGDLYRHIVKVENRHGEASTEWTRLLRHLCRTLESVNRPTRNYAVHKPILINKQKMLEVINQFPDEPMLRALYGNYWDIGGESKPDMKCQLIDYPIEKFMNWEFISTQDESFSDGIVGRYIRSQFNTRSRFEL